MKMQDLKGMPVLTIQEGQRLGRVRNMIVDPATVQVVALLLDRRTPGGEPQVVATANVHTVGKVAITVEDRSSMVPLSRIPRFQELVQTKPQIRGKKVISDTGMPIGRVADFMISPETFRVEGVLLQGFLGRERRIPVEQIRTIGPDAVVVQETLVEFKPTRPAPPPPAKSLPEEPVEGIAPLPLAEELAPKEREEEHAPLPPEGEMIISDEGTAEKEHEPVMPPISTLDETRPPSIVEEMPPEEAEMADMPEAPAEPTEPVEEDLPEEETGEGPDNPWQRWVRRLRRREKEGELE